MSAVLCSQMQIGDCVRYAGTTVLILGAKQDCEDRFGQPLIRYWARREDTGKEGRLIFGAHATLELEFELERIEGS